MDQIQKSEKTTLKYVLELVAQDVRSVTGKNLHHIKLRCGKQMDDRITVHECVIPYREVPTSENWRINFARELIECNHDSLVVDGFNKEELQEILAWITTSGPS